MRIYYKNTHFSGSGLIGYYVSLKGVLPAVKLLLNDANVNIVAIRLIFGEYDPASREGEIGFVLDSHHAIVLLGVDLLMTCNLKLTRQSIADYSRTPHNPYTSVDSPGYGVSGF